MSGSSHHIAIAVPRIADAAAVSDGVLAGRLLECRDVFARPVGVRRRRPHRDREPRGDDGFLHRFLPRAVPAFTTYFKVHEPAQRHAPQRPRSVTASSAKTRSVPRWKEAFLHPRMRLAWWCIVEIGRTSRRAATGEARPPNAADPPAPCDCSPGMTPHTIERARRQCRRCRGAESVEGGCTSSAGLPRVRIAWRSRRRRRGPTRIDVARWSRAVAGWACRAGAGTVRGGPMSSDAASDADVRVRESPRMPSASLRGDADRSRFADTVAFCESTHPLAKSPTPSSCQQEDRSCTARASCCHAGSDVNNRRPPHGRARSRSRRRETQALPAR